MDPPKIYTDCHPLENIHHFSADSSDDDSVKTPTLVFRIWVCGAVGASSGGLAHWPSHTKIRQIQNKRYFYLDRVWKFGAAACFLMFYSCIFQETLRLKSLLPSGLCGRGCGGRGDWRRILNMQTVLILIKKFRCFPQLRARQHRFRPERGERSQRSDPIRPRHHAPPAPGSWQCQQ